MNIRRLTADDVEAVLQLAELAGWNQTDRDIERLLRLEPAGCFAAWSDDRLVGTTTTTTYGTTLAWVGMVLVDPDYRRRGIATALMIGALDYLRKRRVATIKLDATPAGRPVYERLGFQTESVLERWAGTVPDRHVSGVTVGQWEDIAVMDRAAFGADRSALMRMIVADSGLRSLVVGTHRPEVDGYASSRAGRRAAYIGPVVARDLAAARSYLTAVAAGLGPAIIDVDTEFPGATAAMGELGFRQQRELMRMRLGPPLVPSGLHRVFAIAGPEVG